jgi:hypothetical protein
MAIAGSIHITARMSTCQSALIASKVDGHL